MPKEMVDILQKILSHRISGSSNIPFIVIVDLFTLVTVKPLTAL